jgi:hypothetical protein
MRTIYRRKVLLLPKAWQQSSQTVSGVSLDTLFVKPPDNGYQSTDGLRVFATLPEIGGEWPKSSRCVLESIGNAAFIGLLLCCL